LCLYLTVIWFLKLYIKSAVGLGFTREMQGSMGTNVAIWFTFLQLVACYPSSKTATSWKNHRKFSP